MKVLSLRHTLASASLALALASCASLASAQDFFVALAAKTNVQPVLAIPAPGNGWEFSAAAPVPGTQWNRVRRPNGIEATSPAIRSESAPASGKTGRFALGDKESFPLVDSTGQPSAARLSISVNIVSLADDKPRSEPNFHSKSKQAVPAGLMDGAWRVYLEGNGLVFTLSGLVPGKVYDLYVYGAGNDPQSTENPAGDGQGARFTLAVANTSGKGPDSAETLGGFYSSLYTFNPESGVITLSPVGTTWAKLRAVVDSDGVIRFTTGRNGRRSQYVNGFQLVETRS